MKHILIARTLVLSLTVMALGLLGGAPAWSQSAKGHPDTAGWKDLFAPDLSNVVMPPFKVSKEANSGVFLRSGNINDVLAALEIQVHENADGALYGMVGAIYNAKPPSKPMQKPVGEWNRFTITCQDSHVALIFNGEEVFNIDLNDWKEAHKNPDGTQNKFGVALKDFSRKGPLGLQGLHGRAQAAVWYRNIKIKELK
ncbi:MAG: DUF1080 domain-containing protein [Verrucomicrobia bacterium]|nr:DUF1080 domain-containing protein [Verrucomicrobiota bacterium]